MRNSKNQTNPKYEIRNGRIGPCDGYRATGERRVRGFGFAISWFGFVSDLILRISCLLAFVSFQLCSSSWLHADNVDLSTVPARDSVQLTIYNSEDLTLVRETRKVSFKNGVNPLQFSWANTLIDPTSVQLRFLT